jgi:hypothetical protein
LFVGFNEKGSLWVAQTSDRLHTLKRQYSIIKALEIDSEILSVEKLKEKVPIIDPYEVWVWTKSIKYIIYLMKCMSRVVFGYQMILWLILFH